MTNCMTPETFCADPILTREISRLPESDCFNHTVVDEKSCEVMYRIETLLGKLAPMGMDNMRRLWIETVRGDINDWKTYEKWAEDEDEPTEEKWREDWLFEYPNEVEWYEIVTRQYMHLHSLIIYNDRIHSVDFANQEDAYGEKKAHYRYDFSEFLLKLESYLSSVVERIEEDPDSYNEYVEKNLSYYHRKGTIKAKEWLKILPDSEILVKGSDDIIKVLKSKPKQYPEPMYESMTLRKYIHIWRIAYDAFHENIDWDWAKPYKADLSVTDEQMFERSPKGREAFDYDLDSEKGFKEWWNENHMYHCYDIVYARVHLIPQEQYGKSGWSLYFCGDGEGYLLGTIGAAVALVKAGIPFEFDTKEYVDFLRGNFTIEIDPLDPRSSVECPRRFLPYPGGNVSQEQVDRLIAEIKWKKQKKVRLKKK